MGYFVIGVGTIWLLFKQTMLYLELKYGWISGDHELNESACIAFYNHLFTDYIMVHSVKMALGSNHECMVRIILDYLTDGECKTDIDRLHNVAELVESRDDTVCTYEMEYEH